METNQPNINNLNFAPPVQPLQPVQPQVQNPPAPVQPQVAPPKSDLQKAVDFIGRQIKEVREWTGRDNRLYASGTLANVKPPSAQFATVQDLAKHILAGLSQTNTYITYNLQYAGKRVKGRAISISKDGELVMALQIAYAPTNIQAGFTTLQPRANADGANLETSAVVNNDDAFGAI